MGKTKFKMRYAAHLSISVVAGCSVPALGRPVAQPVSITDIVETKLIDSLSVSPDGHWAAFRLITRSVQADTITGQWYRIGTDGRGRPDPLGSPFTPLQVKVMGFPEEGVSQWAPDSSALYVLNEKGVGVQVHRLTPGAEAAVTADPADVESFQLSPDGREMTYTTRSTREAIDAAQKRDNAAGIHFDASILTEGLALTNNFRIGQRVTTLRRFPDESYGEAHQGDLITHSMPLSMVPAAHDPGTSRTMSPLPTIRIKDVSPDGARLSMGRGKPTLIVRQLVPRVVDGQPGQNQIEADMPDGRHVVCQASFCLSEPSAMRLVTFDASSNEAIVVNEPDYSGRTIIQAWNPATGSTRVVRQSTGAIDRGSLSTAPCLTTDHSLLCVEAGPTRPPRLISIDVHSGRDQTLFDPNIDLAGRHFPSTRLFNWQSTDGTHWNGVLVLPEKSGPGKVPLVITSYRCRGFLQGGTGWLAPEFILAQKGIAALCLNSNLNLFGRSDEAGALAPMEPYKAMDAAFQGAIEKLNAEGLIDPDRVGVAGHSFTANAATYAISHTKLFRAAVIGSGVTIDPATYSLVAPAADSPRKAVYNVIGMPAPSNDPKHLWEEVSPALNAHAVSAALLMQTTENEWLFNLQQFTFLQDAHKTVDMYVYPGEGHMAAARPIHQFWRNKRSVDWFSKWLLPQQP